jgi:hypothetical protein
MELNIVVDKFGAERVIGIFDLYLFNTDGYHMTYYANVGKWGLIDYTGKIILPADLTQIDSSIGSERICAKQGEQYGYFDLNGKLVIDFQFENALTFSNGIAAVVNSESNKKFFLIDTNGKQLTEPLFDYVYGFHGGELARFSKDNMSGFIDNTGKIVIESKYDNADVFSEGLVAVAMGDKWGAINEQGKQVIDFQFSDRFDFREGMARIQAKEGYGYIDKSGAIVIPCQYSFATNFRDSIAIVKKDNNSWMINRSGNRLTKENYSHISAFDDSGLALVLRNGLMGYIDKNFSEVIPCQYEKIDFFYEGLAMYKSKDKVIYIDQKNNNVIERKCTKAGKFSDGLARFEVKKKRGFINKNNEVVIEPKYDSASDFYKGYAICGIKQS